MIQSFISNGSLGNVFDVGSSIFGSKDVYSGPKGNITAGMDTAFDTVSNTVMEINPLAGTIMKGAGLLGSLSSNFGNSNDGMTTLDAALNSKFLSWTPLAMAANFGGKKSIMSSYNGYRDLQKLNSNADAYSGSEIFRQDAMDKQGKKYSLFSSGARHRANNQIREADRQSMIRSEIADNNLLSIIRGQYQTSINNQRYKNLINGGLGTVAVGKSGIKVNRRRLKNIIDKSKQPESEYSKWLKTVPDDRLNDNYDLESAYNYYSKENPEQLEKWRTATPEQLENDDSYHLESVVPYGDGDYIFLKKGREWDNPEVNGELQHYHLGKTGLQFSHDLVFDEDQNRYFYKKKKGYTPQSFKNGGQVNVIPEGALHARKNNMEGAGKDFTAKGIPVVDSDGNQQAEIEVNEIIFCKNVTEKLENYYKKFQDESLSWSKKNEIAVECGKLLVKEILTNTQDRTGLIEEIKDEHRQ